MRVIYLSEEKTERDLGPMHAAGIVKITVVSNSGKKDLDSSGETLGCSFPFEHFQSAHNKCGTIKQMTFVSER